MNYCDDNACYREVESMLYDYNDRLAKLKILTNDLEQLEEMIYLSSPVIDDMPHGTITSDPTARTVLDMERERDEMMRKIKAHERFIAKMDTALGLLPRDEYLVLRYRYLLRYPWGEVAIFMGFSVTHCKRIRRGGIKNLVNLLAC